MKLIIKNVGPIREVELNIRTYNFIIGEQSSGKSTIAKILSFCMWLEKSEMMQVQKETYSEEFFNKNLMEYHRMNTYFNETSYVKYDGKYIEFILDGSKENKYTLKDKVSDIEYKRNKIAYIPAERIIVSLPYISKYNFDKDYIQDFVFNWLEVRSKISKSHPIQFHTLGFKYYYEKDLGDMLLLDGKSKAIPLDSASSGMQSITPVYVYLNYLFNEIYKEDFASSFDKMHNILSLIRYRVEKETNENIDSVLYSKDDKKKTTAGKIISNIIHYNNTSVIMEEPEISLYPSTQIKFLNKTVSIVNKQREDILFITTHSPYIINQLNLLIKASDKQTTIDGAAIDYDDISVYNVADGVVRDLKIENARFIDTNDLSNDIEQIYKLYEGLEDGEIVEE